jgi:eukaryotic-like serine/threonine-protein kinase
MPLSPGTKLGPYEIVAQLGAGGMGEVYRARDTRLDRIVAIKVLPGSLANDPDRLQRFEGEARALSTLNHPNLLAIYDVGTQDGLHYLVSEFLEGETLRDRLASGPLGQRKASEYGLQLANGLAAAHEKGIVHRDLKPENIFITGGDHVKILDFGLAKQAPGIAPGDNTVTMTSTGASSNTAPGTVMGTVGYMSPEQVRGQALDYRSDIFSFGAILYEMVAGRRAFKGDSGVETMNAILKEEPPELDAAQLKVSPGMERIIRHCLEKNPANRFQSARDLGFALSSLSGSSSGSAGDSLSAQAAALRASDAIDTRRLARTALLPWLVAALLALVAAASLYHALKPSGPQPVRMQFTIPVSAPVNQAALSPDGSMLALVTTNEDTGENVLSVQRVGSTFALALPGTEGATYPFFSPDNAWLAFFAAGKLKKAPTSGGTPQTITSAPSGRGGSWSSRNVILYSPGAGGPVWRVNPDGSGVAPVTTNATTKALESDRWAQFLPDGQHFIYFGGDFSVAHEANGVFFGTIDDPKHADVLVMHENSSAMYGDGYLYYVDADESLTCVPFDGKTGKITGTARKVAERVGFQPSTYWGAFSVAANGTLVYNVAGGAQISQLTWYDRAGKITGHVGDPGVYANPSISYDGNTVAADVTDEKANNVDIWLFGVKTGLASRFTFNPSEEVSAAWSRKDDRIAFRSDVDPAAVETKKTQGFEKEKTVHAYNGADDEVPNSWSLDDSAIVATAQLADGSSALRVIDVNSHATHDIIKSKTSVSNGQISPDGKWLAYASNESGEWQVYVTSWPSGEGKWQVSRDTGTEPRWRGDTREIFYVGPGKMLTAAPVEAGASFAVGTATPLFRLVARERVSSTDLSTYDVARDGQHFIVNRYLKPDHVDPLTIVLHSNATPDAAK